MKVIWVPRVKLVLMVLMELTVYPALMELTVKLATRDPSVTKDPSELRDLLVMLVLMDSMDSMDSMVLSVLKVPSVTRAPSVIWVRSESPERTV